MKRKIIGLSLVAIICIGIAIFNVIYSNTLQTEYNNLPSANKTEETTVLTSHAVNALRYNALIVGIIGLGLVSIAASTKMPSKMK